MSAWSTRGFWTAYTLWQARHEASLPGWPPERVRAVQRRRLRRMLEHASRQVPFYRDAMDRLGARPGELRTPEDLSRLPIVTKENLETAPESFRARGLRDERCLLLDSSGTSGRSRTIRHDPASLFVALAHGQRQRAVLRQFTGRLTGYREMVMARPNGSPRQIRRFYEGHSIALPGVELTRAYLPLLGVSLGEQVERINEFRPTVLRGYGSLLGSFFRRVAERGPRVALPKAIVYGADAMPAAERELIEGQFGVPVLSTYQAAEALRIGFQCEERRGFHLFVDDLVVRVVDDEGRDVAPGERGHVLLSNLTNRATVLLNYRLGDIVRLRATPCPCGRRLPAIEGIEGRSDDMLVLASGEEVHSLVLLEKLQAVPGVVQVQVIQEETDRFELRVVGKTGADRARTERNLLDALAVGVGRDAAARVAWLERIPPEASGKTRAVISHCRQAPGATTSEC